MGRFRICRFNFHTAGRFEPERFRLCVNSEFHEEKTTVAIGRPVFFHFVRSDSEISGFFRIILAAPETARAAFDDLADIAFIKIGVDQFSVIAVDGSRLRVDGIISVDRI